MITRKIGIGASFLALGLTLGLSSGPAAAEVDPLTCEGHPATFIGTPEADVIDTNARVIVTLGGDDEIIARRSAIICAGPGDDQIMGDSFGHRIFAGPGDDWVDGGGGDDLIEGRGGDDEIFGTKGSDVIRGGAGNDHLEGNGGEDRLYGNLGNDRLEGGHDWDQLFGGPGRNSLKQ